LFVPSYVAHARSGELQQRIVALEQYLAPCILCPHICGNNRLMGEIARCHAGRLPIVSAFTAHFGEEPCLVGTHGVGNIFFGNCNLRCVYCQNFQISQNHKVERAHEVEIVRLADIMLELQNRGCHSIGLVSPTHFVPQIIRAVAIAADRGLHLPLIYNTNAYDSVEVIRLLDGIVDIYLPDLKYAHEDLALRYSHVSDYPRHARAAIKEMHRQVGGDLVFDATGVVQRGLIIRHLVLPNDLAGSAETLTWIHDELGTSTSLSVMAQYYPSHKADDMPLIDRKIRESEYTRVLAVLERLHLEHGWVQEFDSPEYYRPEFHDRAQPFKGGADNDEETGSKIDKDAQKGIAVSCQGEP
jgi:putative pyruvate formate lyase activating enzyme